ncbi:MAG: Prefoldin subunit alpha [Euryarchaeota archaeon UBA443]|nr:MAG: Prefoldin subunit alpha [Euryarchaeota archaeon UBA443]
MEQSELQRTARLVEMNRERFHEVQERIEQVINVLGEHDVTATILETLAKKNHDSEMKMHVSIGAGVTLTCQHPGGGEGTTIVDLGSGIFGERTWSDAAILTRERMEELGPLLENLQSQSQQLETTITALAQSFTVAAESQDEVEMMQSEETPEVESDDSEHTIPKPKRRRGGMFGNELTLDD